ncbi:hypothetical protein UFOVP410_95 [uncultured Caudovirales phage]|uniref:Uncharacterized protein n=1 Tax=uncultured Caudovirales phage TaxID=2100421 RepID=A0A6J5M839_9CAUD|nr:hypothetical protein UFOVP410_95 [uncultured Caudovirales phage]
MEKKLLSFKHFLTEAKEVIDLRHKDFRQDSNVDPKLKKMTDYISVKDGFYWSYYNAILILSSHEDQYTSGALFYAQQHDQNPSNLSAIKSPATSQIEKSWNQLSGLVDYKNKTVSISKEYSGNSQRQRTVSNIKEFQQAFQSLMKYGVREDFKVKGAPPHIPKTVKDVLLLKNPLDTLLSPTEKIVMYHGTSQSRWEIIKQKGLLPRSIDSNRQFKDDVYNDLIPNYSEKNVYLSTTKKTADFYAKRQAKKDESDPIVLKIELPDNSKLIPDDRFVQRKNLSYDFKSFKSSLTELGEFAYRGIIPPKFIKPV